MVLSWLGRGVDGRRYTKAARRAATATRGEAQE
jgi:hypothetical protein